jgi:hypothetical protein
MKIRKKRLGEGAADYPEFHARFDRFKSRTCLHNIKLTGKSAQEFVKKLFQNSRKRGYCARQIFNLDEAGLFWKKTPRRIYLTKEEAAAPGHKAAKDRLAFNLVSVQLVILN